MDGHVCHVIDLLEMVNAVVAEASTKYYGNTIWGIKNKETGKKYKNKSYLKNFFDALYFYFIILHC